MSDTFNNYSEAEIIGMHWVNVKDETETLNEDAPNSQPG